MGDVGAVDGLGCDGIEVDNNDDKELLTQIDDDDDDGSTSNLESFSE